MKNYDKKFLDQAVNLLEELGELTTNYSYELYPKELRDEIKGFLNRYQRYQCQKDEKMHGDL